MTTLLKRTGLKNYVAIADTLSKELAVNAVGRDREAGIPAQEVQWLRESGLLPLVVPQAY